MPNRLSPADVETQLGRIPAWQSHDDAISRRFEFADFAAALQFVNVVADRAEKANHHPDIDIRWNKVLLRLSTHSAGGLTELDFSLAEKIDAAARVEL